MAPELPGYYYDEAKKKYFKITKNHTAPSSSSSAAYSADSVKRRKLDDEVLAEAARRQDRMKKMMTRSRVLRNPTVGAIIAREHGYKMDSRTKSAAAVHDWQPSERVISENIWKTIVSGQGDAQFWNGSEKPKDETGSLSAFAYDAQNDMCFLPRGWDLGTLTSVTLPSRIGETPLMMGDSTITSISFDEESRTLISTWRCPFRNQNVFLKKIDAEFPNTSSAALALQVTGFRGARLEVLTSTTSPPGARIGFAIGTSDRIMTIDRTTLEFGFIAFPELDDEITQSIFAVEFLCKQPEVILAGQRSGRITLIDTRQRFVFPGYSNTDFQHPSSVSHIRSIDEHRLVVAGPNSTLCQYDLRFRKKGRPQTTWLDSNIPRHMQSHSKGSNTVPIQTYPEHNNEAYLDLGFAVDAEAGLLAAAQSGQGNKVMIFSLHGGGVVRTIDAEHDGSSIDLAPCRAMKFVDDSEGRQLKSLWVAKGTKIIKYGH